MKFKIVTLVELDKIDQDDIPILASEICQDVFRTIRNDPHTKNLTVTLYETEVDQNKDLYLESHSLAYIEVKEEN